MSVEEFDDLAISTKTKSTISLALMLPVCLYWGWTISVLWGWFITPMVAWNIGVLNAAGLRLIFKSFTGPDFKFQDVVADDDWIVAIIVTAISPLLILGVGWILHFYMGG